MKIIIVLELETSKDIPDLDKLVQNRAYTIDGVEDVKIIPTITGAVDIYNGEIYR
ncbi:MAG: hypothetical protein V4493_01150 [Pseudomonadota bacterium]